MGRRSAANPNSTTGTKLVQHRSTGVADCATPAPGKSARLPEHVPRNLDHTVHLAPERGRYQPLVPLVPNPPLPCTSQCWSRQTQHGLGSVHLDAPGQRHGQQPASRTADPEIVKQDTSSRGFVDTTKTRSDPRRVRMSSGERPIGAAKGKQPNTEALCQPPPLASCISYAKVPN